MRALLTFVVALILTAVQPAEAETPLDHLPALKGGYFLHQSKAVGRPFHIYIRLPQDYAENPSKRYPVVYLLDGDSLFPILAANHLFLHFDENMPEAIVVGIAYGSFAPAINKRDCARRMDCSPGPTVCHPRMAMSKLSRTRSTVS